jgi:hypothetical protein
MACAIALEKGCKERKAISARLFPVTSDTCELSAPAIVLTLACSEHDCKRNEGIVVAAMPPNNEALRKSLRLNLFIVANELYMLL